MNQRMKSSRVSWAPGANLCQVRLFLSKDCTSKFYHEDQHHPQIDALETSRLNCVNRNCLPNGKKNPLKGMHVNSTKEECSQTSQIKWKCPPKFDLDRNWCVASGEESKEREAQKHREMRVLEAVYPSVSAIPPSPSLSMDVEDFHPDDSHIPAIPITPIEEAAAAAGDLPTHAAAAAAAVPQNSSISINSQALTLAQDSIMHKNLNTPLTNPYVSLKSLPVNDNFDQGTLASQNGGALVAAAAASLAAAMKNEDGRLIDTELLIQFLSNPQMIEKLINCGEMAANISSPTLCPKPEMPETPLPSTKHDTEIPLRSTKHDLVTKKSCNERGAAVSSGIATISESMRIKPLVPLSGSAREAAVIRKPENEVKMFAQTGAGHIPGPKTMTQSVPFLPRNLHNKIEEVPAHLGMPNVKGPRPVAAPSSPLPSLMPDMKTIKRMINEYGPPDDSGNENVILGTMPPTPSLPFSSPKYELPDLDLEPRNYFPWAASQKNPPRPNAAVQFPFSTMTNHIEKDINYFKNLIKRHGESQDAHDPYVSQLDHTFDYMVGPPEPKYQKPCMYFHSSKGCRYGSNCPYQHHGSNRLRSGGVLEASVSKRMKVREGITGRIQ